MNILHTSDLHLGKMLENFSRLPEQEQFFHELEIICDNEDIDIILIAGDVYDVKNPKALAEKLFYNSLKKLSKNGQRLIIIIAGNHDSHERIMTLKPLVEDIGIIIVGYPHTKIDVNKYNNYQILESYEGCFKILFKEQILNVITLPYPSEHSLNIYFDTTEEIDLQKLYNNHIKEFLLKSSNIYNDSEINLMIAHIFLKSGKITSSEQALSVGGSLQLKSDILPKSDYIALGHLHRSQEINGNQISYYSGSPIAYSFSEYNHKKSVNICNINFINNKKNINVKKAPLTTYIPLEIWKVNSPDEAIKICEENKNSNSYVDINIKTNEVLSKSFFTNLRNIKNNIVSINTITEFEHYDTENDYYEFEHKTLIEEFKDYYKYMYNTDPEEKLLQLFLDIGEQEND